MSGRLNLSRRQAVGLTYIPQVNGNVSAIRKSGRSLLKVQQSKFDAIGTQRNDSSNSNINSKFFNRIFSLFYKETIQFLS